MLEIIALWVVVYVLPMDNEIHIRLCLAIELAEITLKGRK